MTFQEFQLKEYGYECITTFWEDFTIADKLGLPSIKDTYERAFKEWKNNYKFLTELVLVLNHKCWTHFAHNKELSKLYSELYYQAHNYACEHLKGEEYSYYYNIVD